MKIIERQFGRFEKDGIRYEIRREEGDTQMPRVWAVENGYTLLNPADIQLERARAAKKKEVAAARYDAEFGGFRDSETGMFIRTDERTRNLLNSATMEAKSNPAFIVPNWKLADGLFITLTAQTIIMLYNKVWEFIAAQFEHEHNLCDQIDAASTVEELNSIKWE